MLSKGDEIRVVSPSKSFKAIGGMKAFEKSLNDLNKLGFKVTFGRNIDEHDILDSASIAKRVEDIHEAYLDDNVKVILTTIGGYTSNELLPYLDFARDLASVLQVTDNLRGLLIGRFPKNLKWPKKNFYIY